MPLAGAGAGARGALAAPTAITVGDALVAGGFVDVVQGPGLAQGVDARTDDALATQGLVVVVPVATEAVGDLGEVVALPAVEDLTAGAVGDAEGAVEVLVGDGQAGVAVRVQPIYGCPVFVRPGSFAAAGGESLLGEALQERIRSM